MVRLGYALSSEEHPPTDLIENASRAEEVGFEFALVSDHFHPWTSVQGHSPFVWNVLGAISERTEELEIGTGVTCPIIRIHPVNVAQAAATAAVMMPDRFFLGVGTGENLNEHVVGEGWPGHGTRLEMLEEAIEVIRHLWEGETYSHDGQYFTVDNARLYTTPEDSPPLHVAAGGPEAASAVGRVGDGIISTSPDESLVEAFLDSAEDRPETASGDTSPSPGDAPKIGMIHICWGEDEVSAVETAYEYWPNGALPGGLARELPMPIHFEQAAQLVEKEDVAEALVCGPDADEHVEAIEEYVDAGFDHVYVHQVGPDQESFFEGYAEEVLPQFE